jgi:8-oxo-dGTP pyrophosphatase MutT (NUDIX family)
VSSESTPAGAQSMPVREAATVILVRDGERGLEVFMLKRSPQSDFVPGQFVFPGGAVDQADRDDPDLAAVCLGHDDVSASAVLSRDSGGLAYWVAAVRECFEEAGVLLGRREGETIPFVDPVTVERFEQLRQQVYDGEIRLAEMCEAEDIQLDFSDLRYVSHWITPVGPPRRFDTRFFVAHAPDGQHPLHDGGETVESTWITPAEAMRQHQAGEFQMILPTVANLKPLLELDSVDAVMAWADALSDIPEILPAIVLGPDGERSVLLPGDEGYEAALAAPPPEGSTS